MDTAFCHTGSIFYSLPPYSLPREADLWSTISGFQWGLAPAAWTGHQKEERNQRINSLGCIPVKQPQDARIPQSKITVPLKTPLSTLLFSRFQQPHPFHILWARDINDSTVTSTGTLYSPYSFPKPNFIFVNNSFIKPFK